jgi:D-alanyl-D-alanine carboxypeptidase (penicillin-binding protein 5/6)
LRNHIKSKSTDLTSSNKTIIIETCPSKTKQKFLPFFKAKDFKFKPIDKTPPYVSAKSWAIFDCDSKQILVSKLSSSKLEIASLTKIMVFHTWIKISSRFSIDPETELVEIYDKAVRIPGTSARLVEGDQVILKDLYYALMLPSGNDAGYALASHFGAIIIGNNKQRNQTNNGVKLCDLNSHFTRSPTLLCFIKEMNFYAQKIGMQNTFFDSPHGLANILNISTSKDQCVLISHWFNQPIFDRVVNTKIHTCETEISSYTWVNTNKLLKRNFSGVKTGITESAGPCLAISKTKKILHKEIRLILVLLNCKSTEDRWREAPKLIKWCFDKLSRQILN